MNRSNMTKIRFCHAGNNLLSITLIAFYDVGDQILHEKFPVFTGLEGDMKKSCAVSSLSG